MRHNIRIKNKITNKMTNASQKHHKTLKEQELQGCMADTRLLLI